MLENAVEKRAAEAPELRHSGPRHELGSFWEEIVRNHSGLLIIIFIYLLFIINEFFIYYYNYLFILFFIYFLK